MTNIEVFESDKRELERAVQIAERHGECTDIACLVSSLTFYLPEVLKEDFGHDKQTLIETKYNALLNVLFDVARLSSQTGQLYMVDDETIYTVLKALEPELYDKKVNEIKEG